MRYSIPTLHIDFTAGTGIESACVEAVALAKKLDVMVDFSFNGVGCHARPSDDPNHLAQAYFAALKQEEGLKIAYADPDRPVIDPITAQLRLTVAAKLAYWREIRKLEQLTGTKGEWTDKQSDRADDAINNLAAGADCANTVGAEETSYFLKEIQEK